MKDIVIKYLNKQYAFTATSYLKFTLIDRVTNEEIGLARVLKNTIKVLSIDEAELSEYFDAWVDKETVLINNKIIDYKFDYYTKFGVEIELSMLEAYLLIRD